jgi:hypothetical protein
MLRDEPIYYINQFSILRRPKVWSKRDYWTLQILSTIVGIPIMALAFELEHVPVLFTLAVVWMVSFPFLVYNHLAGRRRAERFRMELSTGGPTPFFGKYPLAETRPYRRV